MNGEPSFKNIKKLCEPHIIFKESAAKLIRSSKFGFFQYRYGIVLVTRNLLTDGPDHKEIIHFEDVWITVSPLPSFFHTCRVYYMV